MLTTSRTPSNPKKSSPKIFLSRKVHFLWFIDGRKTHQVALSCFTTCSILVLLLFILAYFIYLLKAQSIIQHEITQNQQAIHDLKKSIVDDGLKNYILDRENLRKKASIINSVKAQSEKQSLESLKAEYKEPGMSQTLVQFLDLKTTPAHMMTIVRFTLANASKRALQGKVCAQIKLRSGEYLVSSQDSVPPLSNKETCINGESVRFNRFRPVEIEFEAKQADIEAVTVIFYESQLMATFLHDLKL